MNNATLSPDNQAILLLCLRLSSNVTPLDLSEYNKLEVWLENESRTPQDLFEVTSSESKRIEDLLNRGLSLSIFIERCASKGIWIFTRRDREYPERLRLRNKAPIIIFGIGNKALFSDKGSKITSLIPDIITEPTIAVLKNDLAKASLIKRNRDYIQKGLLTLISATEP